MDDVNGGAPAWPRVLAVVAHPDDESFGLGAVISAFVRGGAVVTVLCLTHGEASTLHGVAGDLSRIRERELHDAADALGVDRVLLLDLPDGALAHRPLDELAGLVVRLAREVGATGLLAFDDTGITGHPDHRQATAAAVEAARSLRLGVLGWTVPGQVAAALNREFGSSFWGRSPEDVDIVLSVNRERQLRAVGCHASQAIPGSVLFRRLELLGDSEHLRWLRVAED